MTVKTLKRLLRLRKAKIVLNGSDVQARITEDQEGNLTIEFITK